VARYGGEEFAVILPDTDLDGAYAVAQRMVEAVRALGWVHESSQAAQVVTISAGAYSMVPTIAGAKMLLRGADEALYQAKGRGRNCAMQLQRLQTAPAQGSAP